MNCFRLMDRAMRLLAALWGILLCAGAVTAHADEPKSIRIGYAISKTGAYASGVNTTTLPNYQLWVRDVNAAGGIMLKTAGRRLPIEVVEYDDQSDPVEAQKAIEQLATADKVDFILPPWGTHLNLAAAPLFNRYGYPQLTASTSIEQVADYAKTSPWTFFSVGLPSNNVDALVRILAQLRENGKIGSNVAMAHVADSFGANLAGPAHMALKRERFNLVFDRTYPVNSRDLQPVISQAAASKPDVFLAFSYPADTFAITEKAIELHFDPKVFFVAVGTAFPTFKQHFGPNVDGIMGMGGWDASLPALQVYFRRHVAVIGREPDRWVSPLTYATLEILQQAIERAGTLDRTAVLEQIKTQTFETQMGPVRYEGNMLNREWDVGQWQNGEFYGVAPTSMPGARAVLFPKPSWRPPE
jgi:branched-chain amino acid transport system substrate-binding protein